MSLSAGTRLGSYEITAAVGAGGPPPPAHKNCSRAAARLAEAQLTRMR
jgi:hypothetical protein